MKAMQAMTTQSQNHTVETTLKLQAQLDAQRNAHSEQVNLLNEKLADATKALIEINSNSALITLIITTPPFLH